MLVGLVVEVGDPYPKSNYAFTYGADKAFDGANFNTPTTRGAEGTCRWQGQGAYISSSKKKTTPPSKPKGVVIGAPTASFISEEEEEPALGGLSLMCQWKGWGKKSNWTLPSSLLRILP